MLPMLFYVGTAPTAVQEVHGVNWEDLVCAACAGRVVEGRCATCREARDEMRSRGVTLPAAQFLIAAAVLIALLLVLTH
jgi:hypothetical protein